MKAVNCVPVGHRLGNAMFSYAHARGYAEKHGYRLFIGPWIGQKIFDLDDPPIEHSFPRRTENDVEDGEYDIEFRTYAQSQKALTYTRAQAKEWFRLRPEIARFLAHLLPQRNVAHHRKGDYFGEGSCYPVVSRQSYKAAARKFLGDHSMLQFVSEEEPISDSRFTGELACVPDFLRMMKADNLFRANSSFSWWAGVLGDGVVYSPMIEGLVGGKEHDNVEFLLGNHPRLATFDFTTDLHLPE